MMGMGCDGELMDVASVKQRASLTSTLTMPARWQRRRWSLRGTDDTKSKQDAAAPKCPTPTPATCVKDIAKAECDGEKRRRSRSVDMSPLHSSLKKAPSALSSKFAHYVEVMKLRSDALPWHHGSSNQQQHSQSDPVVHVHTHNGKERRVLFPKTNGELQQDFDRPETTDEEKANYHYSKQELQDMVTEAKESQAREMRFMGQPDGTIFEQGFLTFPQQTHLFHPKRYYCLLKARQILCFASPQHAAAGVHVKCQFPIIKVQECSSMSMQAKISAFGAHLPSSLALLFFVTKADGERVLLSAESRTSKKCWVHTLARLTQVHEVLPVVRQASTSSNSTCMSEDESDCSVSELDGPETLESECRGIKTVASAASLLPMSCKEEAKHDSDNQVTCSTDDVIVVHP